jgi:hypothetical protein
MLEGDRHELGRVEREREKVVRVAHAESRPGLSPILRMLGMCTPDPAQSFLSTQAM